MRQTDADDDRQREQHADPEQDREFSDRLDPPQKKQRGDDADARRCENDVRLRAGHEHAEVVREADAAGGHRQRRGKENLEKEEERDQPARAAVRLAKKVVRAAR